MTDRDAILPELRDAHARFIDLVREIRPELHRYCARMTGSVVDGEDVVQDTLARAYFALGELETVPPLRPWLFRIAHHRAIDFRRRYDRRMGESLSDDAIAEGDPEAAVASADAVRASLALFVRLPPTQRSAVILKDVLGHSTAEIAELLALSVPAVEACLHRGRARLRSMKPPPKATPAPITPLVAHYAALFGAHDWEGVRALLAEDVRPDLVAHSQRVGRSQVGRYFTNYESLRGWRVAPGWLDGREVVALFADHDDEAPAYVIEFTVLDGAISAIRDYRFVPYLLAESEVEIASHTTR
jgi:RNA polymerase sigma factor (sigma-70 family)